MNPDTGHLVDTSEMSQEELKQLQWAGYLQIPKYLQKAARLKLRGRKQAKVSLTSGGRLSKWSAKQRKRRGARSYRDWCN